MLTNEQIIKGCRKNRRKAQKALFDKFSATMRGVCIRYVNSSDEAEDILQEGFIKVFANIKQYGDKGAFEGWIKRIMINTALTYKRLNKKYDYHLEINDVNEAKILPDDDAANEDDNLNAKTLICNADFSTEQIFEVIKQLPEGYKMVFNLYAIENYRHKEIAEMLKIDINTSKSQLARARRLLQKKLCELASDNQSLILL